MKSKKDLFKNNRITEFIIVIDVVIVLTAFIVFAIITKQKDDNTPVQGAMSFDTRTEIKDEPDKNPLEGRSVELVGFDNTVLKQGQSMFLSNSKENIDFLVKFEVINTESGDVVFTTDLIKAGEGVNWTLSNDLEPGKYELAFKQLPFWQNPETGQFLPLTGGTNIVEIEILSE